MGDAQSLLLQFMSNYKLNEELEEIKQSLTSNGGGQNTVVHGAAADNMGGAGHDSAGAESLRPLQTNTPPKLHTGQGLAQLEVDVQSVGASSEVGCATSYSPDAYVGFRGQGNPRCPYFVYTTVSFDMYGMAW